MLARSPATGSRTGRPHLAEAKKVIAAGKPVYIDKPLAGMLADCVEVYETAQEEILKVYAFLAAADVSKNKGGDAVSIQGVLDKAKREVSARDEK